MTEKVRPISESVRNAATKRIPVVSVEKTIGPTWPQ
mgnify:CR=1 FL=1